jgi:predicted nucleic acid-binding protein
MRVLVDTNVLLRGLDPGHPHHPTAEAATIALRRSNHVLVVAPQSLYEFWVAATRPTVANGLGKLPEQVSLEIIRLRRLFELVPDTPAIFDEWLRLVGRHDCRGKPAHDARLVAAMNVHGITHLLTFNGQDFARYSGIQALDPAAVAAGGLGRGAQASQAGGAGSGGGV